MTIPIGFAEAWVQYSLASQPRASFTAFAFEVETPPFTQSNADTLLNSLGTWLDDVLSSAHAIVGGFVLVGSDGGDIRLDVTYGAAKTGARSATSLPPQVAALLKKRTAMGGRRNRGRNFLPGIAEADVNDNGVLSGAFQTILGATGAGIWTALGAGGAANTAGAVLLHESGPTTPTPLTGIIADTVVATQRRRLVRRTS